MARELPTGTVTLLFTDIEGSTRLLHELGPESYAEALDEHRRVLRATFGRHGGVEVDTEGDAFFVAFPDPSEAVAAADEAQQALTSGPIRVRMGLHTGTPHVRASGYVGADVHKGARIAASAHGGQIVLSKESRALLDDRFDLLDLGEHRVKDFAEPVWIYQLGTERFPPLKTISNTNLPRPANSFVGRQREVAEIRGLLRDSARFVTLTGPGGTGKTRLGIEAAAELVGSFKNGVFWVPLAAIRDPALVADTLAATIGAKDDLATFIGEREMLILLDNLEQVIEAAPDLAGLVEACPNLRLLATSRERLRVRGETEYAVPPLLGTEAVELFSERSKVEPDETIRELCRRLDDLPLAVELAAARTAVLSPAQILERLAKRLDILKGGRDSEARQATLRATIEWSHDLLGPEEQHLFARLAVFRGGFSLEAAETVAEADLDVLQSLVDKSLVRRTDERFTMLETIREFAAERLEASGEGDLLRRRHADFYLALAQEAGHHVRGADATEWLDRLGVEHDNVRAALERFEAIDERQTVLEMVGALWGFWYIRGHWAEGRRRLEAALDADGRPTPGRARALIGAAAMASILGDPSGGQRWGEEALSLNRRIGDRFGTAYSTFQLGHVAHGVSDWKTADHLFRESLAAFSELGEDYYVWLATDLVALTAYKLGDRERAWSLAQDNLRRARAAHTESMEMTSLGALGFYAVADGRVDEATAFLRDAIRIWQTHGSGTNDIDEVGLYLCSVARAAALQERPDVATQLIAASRALYEEMAAPEAIYLADLNDETLTILRSSMDEAAFESAWQVGARLTLDQAAALALAATE